MHRSRSNTLPNRILRLLPAALLSASLAACGGGGGGDGGTDPGGTNPGGNDPVNTAPTAVASIADKTHFELMEITLDGTSSSDDETDSANLDYTWTQLDNGAPSVEIIDANKATAAFTPPKVVESETFRFELTVTDEGGESSTATLDVPVKEDDWVVYEGEFKTDGQIELYARRASGNGEPLELTSGLNSSDITNVRISPDRRHVVFVADDTDGVPSLVLVRIGNAPRVVMTGEAESTVFVPRWAPDARRVAFTKRTEPGGVRFTQLYTVAPGEEPVDRSGLAVVDEDGNNSADDSVNHFQWSPDSQFIAYTQSGLSQSPGGLHGFNRLWTVSIETNERVMVSDFDIDEETNTELYGDVELSHVPDNVPDTDLNDDGIADGQVTNFAWSPDGTELAYAAATNHIDVRDLFLVERDGSNPRNLTNFITTDADDNGWPDKIDPSMDGEHFAYIGRPTWSPGSDALAFEMYFTDGGVTHFTSRLWTRTDNAEAALDLDDSGNTDKWDFVASRWNTDGSRVFIIAKDRTGTNSHHVFEVDPANPVGSSITDLAADSGNVDGLVFSFFDHQSVRLAPLDDSGNRMLARGDVDVDGKFALFTVESGSTQPVTLPIAQADDENVRYAWLSPDRQHLLIKADYEGDLGIFLAGIDGSALLRLTPTGAYAAGGAMISAWWQPDSRHGVYYYDEDGENHRLFNFDRKTGDTTDLTPAVDDGLDGLSDVYDVFGPPAG